MKIAYIDPVGGIAGDMLLGALLDCFGKEEEDYVLRNLRRLPLPSWQWQRKIEIRQGFGGTKIDFAVPQEKNHRHLNDIKNIIEKACFPKAVESRCFKTFDLLAEAEEKAHRMKKEDIHFHEVGAMDTILDICGSVLLLEYLGIEKIYASPLPIGKGTVHCAHGNIPIPAPALTELLKDTEIRSVDINGETVTPTGIAILKAYRCIFSPFPKMKILNSGCGCGTKDFFIPNLLRVFIGIAEELMEPDIYRLECTIDDMTGEELGNVWEKIADAGANDMYYTPVFMKKGRPAVKLTVLTEKSLLNKVEEAIFHHTTTLGMIRTTAERSIMKRYFEKIPTPYGEITYKVAEIGNIKKAKAEFEELKKISLENNISVREARQICDHFYFKSKEDESEAFL